MYIKVVVLLFDVMDPAQAFELAEIERHRIIDETIALGNSRVQQFYDGAVVFVTGGTGFLGKQLIEKLIRSCNIKKIYILMRQNKKKTIEERLIKMCEDPVYDAIRGMKLDFTEKITPVEGDVTRPDLGISSQEWNLLTEEVTHIFHGAATINFVEPIKVATLTNVRGTLEILKLGKACKNLKSYVHISTAYCHATPDRVKQDVMETFYKSPIAPDVLVQLVQGMDEAKLDAMTPELIKNWPNTYAFTKAVAEEAVRIEAGNLPICVVRPAIVISALREPLPGWIDKSCALGPSGFVLGVGLGVMHVLYRKKDINLDLVPVDLVNNAIITAAYDTAVRYERGDNDIKIFTVTGTRNPCEFGLMTHVIRWDMCKLMTNKMVYAPCCLETDNKLIFMLFTYLFHYIPGYIIDFILRILRMKLRLVKVYDRVYKLNGVLGYFMTNDWLFSDSNLVKLYHSLSPADRIIYASDMSGIDWKQYLMLWCIGVRKYIIKDGLRDTEAAIRKYYLLTILNPFVVMLYFYGLYKLVCFVSFIVINLFSLFL